VQNSTRRICTDPEASEGLGEPRRLRGETSSSRDGFIYDLRAFLAANTAKPMKSERVRGGTAGSGATSRMDQPSMPPGRSLGLAKAQEWAPP